MDTKDSVAEVVKARLAAKAEREEAQTRQKVRDGALKFLKEWGGSELPPGTQGDPEACVLANALGGSWDASEWRLPEDRLAHRLGFHAVAVPEVVGDFIHRFDAGEYPDLIGAQIVDGEFVTTDG